ncbi:MAG: glycosyltransferase [Phycisphaera sp.]|nr:glycosyltransferase [Phycisphaera sp.]
MPRVSIILPTYNRAGFMPGALQSIRAQTFKDWELIVIDDGSTDETQQVLGPLTADLGERFRYLRQTNAGPAAARNAGIDWAHGQYLAFFDSDDLWVEHHLERCVAALDANADVGWVFGAGKRIDRQTGRVLVEHSYIRKGQPRAFMSLKTRQVGDLRIVIDDDLVPCVINRDHCGGLQASVVRAAALGSLRIPLFRVGEDWALAVRFYAAGGVVGYLPDVHVIYQVHEEQSSASSAESWPLDKRLSVQREYLAAAGSVEDAIQDNPAAIKALHTRLSREWFWRLGYALLWRHGRRTEALGAMRNGLRYAPLNLSMWKTYLACSARSRFGKGRADKISDKINNAPTNRAARPAKGQSS